MSMYAFSRFYRVENVFILLNSIQVSCVQCPPKVWKQSYGNAAPTGEGMVEIYFMPDVCVIPET